ncbi:MAG TPA: hypothetical protein VIQ23_00105 [Hanamia sp.]
MQIQRKSFKWNLAKDYLNYNYSSARFYETGVKAQRHNSFKNDFDLLFTHK